uniref:PH domain-containing protein n=1 Tax=Rhizochromulina marina TaxID=1034831 RepID=A0A7S2SK87_9STRA|mmetsp:Transcript_3144/g.9097  ORF Transcript_3144/g.9097 Transcript_3144/m.9097 type:complete len:534 (+) Transcript_3144:129-1730(+)
MASMFISQEYSDELQNVISGFTGKFSVYMLLGFKSTVIAQAVENAQGEEDDEFQLMEAPVPDWELKTGFLTKRGDGRKNWSKRWFVAKNAADGFIIEYYTDQTLKTKKGVISCAGYKAQKDDKMKKFGITLTPYDESRRVWYIHADSAEEQESWYSIFDNACMYGEPAKDPDAMIQTSFELAFDRLKLDQGIWWRMQHDRSPQEMLAKLLMEVLERGVLRDIRANISDPTGGMLKSMARGMVDKMVATNCNVACAAAWSGAKPAIDAIKNIFIEKVQGMVTPIVELQESTKAKIVESVGSVTDPAFSSIASTALAPVLDKAMGPIVDAYKAGMRGFFNQTEKRLNELADAGTRQKTVQELTSAVSYSYWSESPMVEAYELLRDLRDSQLADVLEHVPGLSIWGFIYTLDDGIRSLIRKAIHTVSKLIEEMSDAGAALQETMDRFAADAKLCIEKLVVSGLKYMIGSLIDENLTTPCVEVVKPLSDAIPEAMQEIVNIEDLLTSTIDDIVTNGVKTAASAGTSGAVGAIDGWRG